MPPVDVSLQLRRALFIAEAQRWVGIQELGGNNKGQVVGIFQAAGKIAPGDPWCMAFVQYCVQHTDRISRLLNPEAESAGIPQSSHCMTVWDRSAAWIRSHDPLAGSIVIWQHRDGQSGHTGVVTFATGGDFWTIEGNTSPGHGIQREGDGVFQKAHSVNDAGEMHLVGFIHPWGM